MRDRTRRRSNPEAATLPALRLFLHQLEGRYPVSRAYLFGSRARGDGRPDSDADLAILLRGPAGNFLETKLALADIAYDILLATGTRMNGYAPSRTPIPVC